MLLALSFFTSVTLAVEVTWVAVQSFPNRSLF